MPKAKITKDFIDEVTFYINNNETNLVELCKIYNVSKTTLYSALDEDTLSKLKRSNAMIPVKVKLELLRIQRENPEIKISKLAKDLGIDPTAARAIKYKSEKDPNYEAILKLKASNGSKISDSFEPEIRKVKPEKPFKFYIIQDHMKLVIETSKIRTVTYKDGNMIITINN